MLAVLAGEDSGPSLERVDSCTACVVCGEVSLTQLMAFVGCKPDMRLWASQGEIAAAYVAGACRWRMRQAGYAAARALMQGCRARERWRRWSFSAATRSFAALKQYTDRIDWRPSMVRSRWWCRVNRERSAAARGSCRGAGSGCHDCGQYAFHCGTGGGMREPFGRVVRDLQLRSSDGSDHSTVTGAKLASGGADAASIGICTYARPFGFLKRLSTGATGIEIFRGA